MGTKKRAALEHAPIAITEREPAPATKPQRATSRSTKVPDRFTYALKRFTAERREDGWWISRTWTASYGEKPQWKGPFATIETACLAIARRLATEIADRHTHSIEWHGLKRSDPRYGLKLTTRLRNKRQIVESTDEAHSGPAGLARVNISDIGLPSGLAHLPAPRWRSMASTSM